MRAAAVLWLLAACNLEVPDQLSDILEVEGALPVVGYRVASEAVQDGPFTNRLAAQRIPGETRPIRSPIAATSRAEPPSSPGLRA